MKTWWLDQSFTPRSTPSHEHRISLVPPGIILNLFCAAPLLYPHPTLFRKTELANLMKIEMFILLAFLCLVPGSIAGRLENTSQDSQPAKEASHKFEKFVDQKKNDGGELIVKFKKDTPLYEIDNLHKVHASKLTKEIPSLRLHEVKLRDGYTVKQAVTDYQKDPNVEYAEPNIMVKALRTPNDVNYNNQWGHAKIFSQSAWDISIGNEEVVVGVIDTGIDYNHPDLVDNVWRRPVTVEDGYTDNSTVYSNIVYGISTYGNSSDPLDDNGHGTHVAGIIGATGNNLIGVSGVNWKVKILACKFLDSYGYGYLFDAIDCLNFIKEMKGRGVNIVATNNSWGPAEETELDTESRALSDAIEEQKGAGILFVAAAGNYASDNDKTPYFLSVIDNSNVISVASTDCFDGMSSFSNYGRRTVHIGAPGQSIISTFLNSAYEFMSGTSMAAPHVTGLAALLMAQDMSRNWIAIKNRILSGGEPFAPLDGMTVTGKQINSYGSMTCSNEQNTNRVMSVLRFPASPVAGIEYPLSALSINCDKPSGFNNDSEVNVAISSGGQITLTDYDRDGLFTGIWVPTPEQVSGVIQLSFSSPSGSETVASPSVKGKGFFTSRSRIKNDSYVFLKHGQYGTYTLSATGGVPPYRWTSLDDLSIIGLSLSLDGVISGTPLYGWSSDVRIKVTDSLSMSDIGYIRILASSSAVDGWPKVLEQRTGNDSLPPSSNPVFSDINGDGRDELIAPDLNTLNLFYGDGTSRKVTFSGPVSTPAVADLNNDGSKEIIVSICGNGIPPSLHVLASDLVESPGFPVSLHNLEGSAGTPVVEDLNNDGNLEVIVVCRPKSANPYEPSTTDDMFILDNQGNSLAGWPKSFGPAYDSETENLPAIGDIDLDQNKEIVFAASDGILRIFRLGKNLPGDIVTQWSYQITSNSPFFSPVLADINSDGQLEIAMKQIFDIFGLHVAIHVYNPDGVQLWGTWYSGVFKSSYDGLIAADIDSNGVPEILLNAPEYSVDALHVVSSDGSLFNDKIISSQSQSSGNPVVGDVNGDAVREILYSSLDEVYNQSWISTLSPSGSTMPPGGNVPIVSRNNFSPALGDFFNDGRIEAAVKSADGILTLMQSGQSSSVRSLEWPVYRHDPQHTGKLPVPEVSLAPLTHDFPSTLAGTTSSAKTFKITNSGPPSLAIISIEMTGYDSSMFILSSESCAPLPLTLNLGQSCTVSVAFAPTAAGSKSANLSIATNSPVKPVLSVLLTGTGQNTYKTLSLSFAGEGRGAVSVQQHVVDPENPPPYLGTCSSNCAIQIDMGSEITLFAGPNENSDFAAWSGCDSVNGPACAILMNSDRSVSATFDIKTIQSAYNAAQDSSVIKLRNITYLENLVCNQSKHITLQGGYESDYGSRSGNTRIDGTVTITSGTVVFDSIEIF